MLPIKSILGLCLVITYAVSQPVNNLPVLNQLQELVTFTPAKPFTLECVLSGNAKHVKYSWNKNGAPFETKSNPNIKQKENEGTLIFNKPSDHDEGYYQCLAESEYGIASSGLVSAKKSFIEIPEITPQKHTAVEGKPFKLDCVIPDAYPEPTIVWMNQSDANPVDSSKILNRRILQSPDGALWFSNVTKQDVSKTHKYVCVAKSPAAEKDVVLAEHYIEDLVESKDNNNELTLQYVTEDMTVRVGDVTMIYCIYGGTPLAHPDWFKDGKDTNNEPSDRVTRYNRSSGRRLLIKDTYLEDEGNYTCVVSNEVGQPQVHSMFLTVVSSPILRKKPEASVTPRTGQDISIPCEVLGHPNPETSWTLNGKPLELSDRITMSHDVVGNRTTADLLIKSVTKSDNGYYGCKAVNDHGEMYSEGLLFVS